ncbi:hypothetical protein H1C71_042460, partial [Ictidomys tridecemlineatus]
SAETPPTQGEGRGRWAPGWLCPPEGQGGRQVWKVHGPRQGRTGLVSCGPAWPGLLILPARPCYWLEQSGRPVLPDAQHLNSPSRDSPRALELTAPFLPLENAPHGALSP